MSERRERESESRESVSRVCEPHRARKGRRRAASGGASPCLWPTKPKEMIFENISKVNISSSGISEALMKAATGVSFGASGEAMVSSMQLKVMTSAMKGSKKGCSTR